MENGKEKLIENIKKMSEKEQAELMFKLVKKGAIKIEPLRRKYKKMQRNEICTCDSGKKWKHCCGSNPIHLAAIDTMVRPGLQNNKK